MPTDADRYQDLSRVVGVIRAAIERAFDMTLPAATTMSGQVDAIVQAIHDVAADRARPTATAAADDAKTRKRFQYRIDVWNDAGVNIVEHVADIEDYAVARAAYDRACRRWTKAVVTLRQGARVIEDSRRR